MDKNVFTGIDAKNVCGCLNICAWLHQVCANCFLGMEKDRLPRAAVALFQVRSAITERNVCAVAPQRCRRRAHNNKVGEGF